jgi:filamentous hemagglutinin
VLLGVLLKAGPRAANALYQQMMKNKLVSARGSSHGVVQSRINISKSGFQHVVDGHFNAARSANKSQFTISQAELRSLLSSKSTVHSAVNKMESGSYERIITLNKTVGNLSHKMGGESTNSFRVITDRLGNLKTAHPTQL